MPRTSPNASLMGKLVSDLRFAHRDFEFICGFGDG